MTQEVRVIVGNEQYVEAKNSEREMQIVSSIMTEMHYAQSVALNSAIVIGRYLTEVKDLMKHGQWENWLADRVNFSIRTAQRFMKLYKEYGHDKIDNSNVLPNLGLSQAFELLALPSGEREQFAEEVEAHKLTITELKEKIKEMKEIKAIDNSEIQKLRAEHETTVKENEALVQNIEALCNNIDELKAQQKEAEAKQDEALAKKLETSIEAEKKKITALEEDKKKVEAQLKALQDSKREAIEKAKAEVQAKADNTIEKKNKEIESMKNRFQSQVDSLKKKNEEQKNKTKEAEARAKVDKEIIKCEVLLGNIESDYIALKDSLKKIGKHYPNEVAEIEKSLGEVLKSMEKRSQLHVVS